MSTFSYHELVKDNLTDSPEFKVNKNGELSFHDLNITEILKEHGTPLKMTYLPLISKKIQNAKKMFNKAMKKLEYNGTYTYCYCTKSSHFSFILEEALNNDIHIETSSAYDIPLVRKLHKNGKLDKSKYIVCNGFKRQEYTENIVNLIQDGFVNTIPVLDNPDEFETYDQNIDVPFKVGLRLATEEVPNFNFYTSRLGIPPTKIIEFYKERLHNHSKAEVTMLHFFINSGIKDHVYYWNELAKCLKIYCQLKRICPSLNTLNIGGGLPFKNSLSFDYDYEGFIFEILSEIKKVCGENGVPEPNIFTEFGTYTVAEASANFYSVLIEKSQNDREAWYMVNNSFLTTLPDIWGIDQRFIILPINLWHNDYKSTFLGGLTCDSMDFYNAEVHNNKIFLPNFNDNEELYIGFFNTGAYQESLSGYGGIKHCLIPSPKHVILDKDKDGNITSKVFREEQSSQDMLKILGY